MASKPDYIFKFSIVDVTSGEVVEADYCTITNANISEFGDCEVVDQEVGRMLRNWRKFARAEYEAENYAPPEEDEESVA
jgi:hypothetical protein